MPLPDPTNYPSYSIYGSLTSSGKIPLIALHGGPGIHGSYLRTLSLLHVDHGIPVLSCGAGTRSDTAQRFNLLGQSWGMLATYSRGLRKLVICNSLASIETWMKVSTELRAALPAETREVPMGNQEHEAAITEFNRRRHCRLDPWPVELEEAFAAWEEDGTVQMTMFWASDWDVGGSLREFSIEGERVPGGLLLVNGQFYIAQDETRWVKFALSAHSPQLEETESFISELGSIYRRAKLHTTTSH
ncbi:hypothetical protein K438DRAFT_1901361 [Mycena galopus ATCC 62051]|nr:hypothetical protein K438DRAFT_1901361 [Mycena galopus ATCC 62051]